MVLGSGKNRFRVPYLGVKKAPDPGSRIRIRNTASNFPLPSPPYTNAVKDSIYPVQARPFRVRKKNKKIPWYPDDSTPPSPLP